MQDSGINFHEEPLGVIKLDASSREAGQDSGISSIGVIVPEPLMKFKQNHIKYVALKQQSRTRY